MEINLTQNLISCTFFPFCFAHFYSACTALEFCWIYWPICQKEVIFVLIFFLLRRYPEGIVTPGLCAHSASFRSLDSPGVLYPSAHHLRLVVLFLLGRLYLC